MKRLPWGHESRHCAYCGRVGPRTIVARGYAHKRCLPPEEQRRINRENRRRGSGSKL